MNFEFMTATRIIFGQGMLREIFSESAKLGKRIFIVTGKSKERALQLEDEFKKTGIFVSTFFVDSEPTIEIIKEGVETARNANCDLVISIGGGSSVDAGKAISALITNKEDIMNYLEVIGFGKPLDEKPLPFIAVPTTAGTGAEVTCNSVITSTQHKIKVSLRNQFMFPKLAIIDPQLTYTLSSSATASTGLDALTQLLEAFVSIKANPFTDALCREGIKRASKSLKRACENGEDQKAREDMSLAALFSGIALSNAKLGAIHGLSSAIGGFLNAPHGFICARLLPFVVEANIRAVQSRGSHMKSMLDKYVELAQILSNKKAPLASDGVRFLHDICRNLNVLPLSKFGLKDNDIPGLVYKAQNTSSMQGNSIPLTNEELTFILKQSI